MTSQPQLARMVNNGLGQETRGNAADCVDIVDTGGLRSPGDRRFDQFQII